MSYFWACYWLPISLDQLVTVSYTFIHCTSTGKLKRLGVGSSGSVHFSATPLGDPGSHTGRTVGILPSSAGWL